MKGTMHSTRFAGVLLGLLATLAGSASIRAQDVQGKFVLPYEVQWQGSTLPAGEYHFIFNRPSNSPAEFLFIGDGQKHHIKMLVMTQAKRDFTGQNVLTIVSRGAKRYVSSLGLEPIGATLMYIVPTQKRAAERELQASVQIIPVQLAGS